MDCKTANTLLPLYFDGELDRATSREFELHLDDCADCSAALVELDGLRRTLRENAPRYTAPAALRKRVADSAIAFSSATDSTSPSSSASRMRSHRIASAPWRFAAAVALAFVAGGSAMLVWNANGSAAASREQIARDLFASHWRALAATSPVDVVSSDRHTVKPWFAGKVAEAPLVQDFAEQGFPLVGGRIDYVGSARVAVLVYRHGQHLIDVFVLAADDIAGNAVPAARNGYRIEAIRLGAQPAAIVTDMDEGEVTKFEQLLAPAR